MRGKTPCTMHRPSDASACMQVAHVLDEPAPATGRDAASDASAASEAPSHLSPWLQPFRTGPTADDLPAGQDQSADQSASALSPELLTLTGKGYQEDDCKVGRQLLHSWLDLLCALRHRSCSALTSSVIRMPFILGATAAHVSLSSCCFSRPYSMPEIIAGS